MKLQQELNLDTLSLRIKWGLGAAESLAGKNGSNINDKESLGYTDEEWAIIWTTMLEDGAWSLSPFKDEAGKVVKENFDPEMQLNAIS